MKTPIKAVTTTLHDYLTMQEYIESQPKALDTLLDKRGLTSTRNPPLPDIDKLLLNAWSAEYALRLTPAMNERMEDVNYITQSLSWTFPQAYYSVLFSTRAVLAMQGINESSEEKVSKRLAGMVLTNNYPTTLDYYAMTLPATGEAVAYRLPKSGGVCTLPIDAARNYLNDTLATIRRDDMGRATAIMQRNPKTAMRGPKGEIRKTFGPVEKNVVGRSIGPTTFFSLLMRLRISSTNPHTFTVKSREEAEQLHRALCCIVNHINTVHEVYIAKSIGIEAYTRQMIAPAPGYLREGFVRDRLYDPVTRLVNE